MVEETSTCPVCGRWIGKRSMCGECIEENRGFHEGHYGFYFDGRLRDALHAFKFRKRKDVGKHLTSLIRDKVALLSGHIDTIIPIPVTGHRLWERGFNQSFIIGEEISAVTGAPVDHTVLFKTRETKDQYTLSKPERRANIKGVFTIRNAGRIADKRVLLVDDLFTTGYTVREAAKVLKEGKAAKVIVFALARTGS
jgi:competence protein ComFC